MNTKRDAALTYAAQGIAVFPCHSIVQGRCTCRRDCGNSAGKHPRTIAGHTEAVTDPEKVAQWWAMWPDANIGAYMKASGVVALDVDPRHGGDESWRALERDYGASIAKTWTNLTGGGGVHYLYHVPNGFDTHIDTIALGVDVKWSGYVILPPSDHRDGRRYEWEAGFGPEDGDLALLPEPLAQRLISRNGAAPSGERTPIAELLLQDFTEGGRNRTLARIAGYLRNEVSQDIAEAVCLTWNAAHCRPPLPDAEILRTVVGMYERYEAPQTWDLDLNAVSPIGDTAAWPVVSARQLRQMDLPPVEWVLDGIVPRGRYTVVSGESGLGKSWWILAYCICAALGMPFLGRETIISRTLYIDEENGIQEAQRRLRALCDGLGVDPDEELPIWFLIDEGVKLGRPADLNRMMQTIAAHGITNVVTDSLIRVFEGNENKSEDVARFHAMVDHVRRKTGVTWWMLQHLNKPNPNGHTTAGDRIRGSGDFKAHADVHIHLRGADSTGTVVIHVEKLRGAPRPADSVYRMEGDTRKGEAVTLIQMGETAAALGAARGAAMEACNVLEVAGSLTVTELIGELARIGISERTAKRGVADARASGAIEVDRTEGRSVWLRAAEATE